MTQRLAQSPQWQLTVKLRGRARTPDRRRRRILSSRAGGAQPQADHGPLQRLLDANAAALKQKYPLRGSVATNDASSLSPASLGRTERQYLPCVSRGESDTR